MARALEIKAEETCKRRKAVAGWVILMPDKEWDELWPALKKLMENI